MNARRSAAVAALLLLAAAPQALANFTVTGTFRYVDRDFTFTGGFTGAEPARPIRLATVQVINDSTGQVLATGFTAQDGTISIPVTAAGTANVVVRCFSRTNQFGGNALRVTTDGSVEYSVSSAVFANWNLNANLDVGQVTAQKVFEGSSQANPFNLLDQGVLALEYVKSVGAPNPSGSVRMVWPGGSGSFASGTSAVIADDDGYDDLVQLHEVGHVLHAMYSDSDSPGGSHTFGDSDQDPRLSIGEGYASAFAGAVRNFSGVFDPGFYMDCSGSGATGGGSIQLRMRMETASPYGSDVRGEADEGAVFCVLWDVIDDAATEDGSSGVDDDPLDGTLPFAGVASADEALWDVLVGPVDSASNLTIRNFWNGFFAPVDYGRHAELEDVFAGFGMRFHADDDEPNGSIATATPIATGNSWGAIRTLYWSAANPPAPGDSDQDHYAFAMASGTTFEVETRYPNGASDADTYCDPRLTVFRPNGTQFATADGSGDDRNALLTNQVADATGTWTVRVDTAHSFRRTGSYQVRARILAEPPGVCENPASATTFGTGKPGVFGTPTLASTTAPVIPTTGFTIQARNGPPFGTGLLLIGTSTANVPFDQGALYVNPVAIVSFPVDLFGTIDFVSDLVDPAACGSTVHLQAIYVNDPVAPGFYHSSQSNRLSLTAGF